MSNQPRQSEILSNETLNGSVNVTFEWELKEAYEALKYDNTIRVDDFIFMMVCRTELTTENCVKFIQQAASSEQPTVENDDFAETRTISLK